MGLRLDRDLCKWNRQVSDVLQGEWHSVPLMPQPPVNDTAFVQGKNDESKPQKARLEHLGKLAA